MNPVWNALTLAHEVNEHDGDGGGWLVGFLYTWVPAILMIGFVIFFLSRLQKRARPIQEKSMQQMEQATTHMKRTEAQMDETISLLKEIRDKLDRDSV